MTIPKISLIIGYPRSGTTWFANTLNSHPSVIYRHEPIGRLNDKLDKELYHALKHNYGLTEECREKLIQFLINPHVECDRPPFFVKDHLTLPPTLRYLLWLATHNFPKFTLLNQYCSTPSINENTVLLIKETSANPFLPSIIEGLRPKFMYFIIRHPCGVVASHLKGYKLGVMKPPSVEVKLRWYKWHSQFDYFTESSIDEATVLKTNDVEFTVLRWRVYHQMLMELHNKNKEKSQILIYEELQRNFLDLIPSIFSKSGLDHCQMTKEFLSSNTNKNDSFLKSFLLKDSGNDFYSVFRHSGFKTDAWKKELTPQQIETVLTRVADMPLFQKLERRAGSSLAPPNGASSEMAGFSLTEEELNEGIAGWNNNDIEETVGRGKNDELLRDASP